MMEWWGWKMLDLQDDYALVGCVDYQLQREGKGMKRSRYVVQLLEKVVFPR